jgi:hypothetical protein
MGLLLMVVTLAMFLHTGQCTDWQLLLPPTHGKRVLCHRLPLLLDDILLPQHSRWQLLLLGLLNLLYRLPCCCCGAGDSRVLASVPAAGASAHSTSLLLQLGTSSTGWPDHGWLQAWHTCSSHRACLACSCLASCLGLPVWC